MSEDDQSAVIAFLADPRAHGLTGPDRVETVETHISVVFLAGDLAFKLKRAVRFPYLDFSTMARRRAACAEELRLNRRTAPQLYLALRAVTREAAGGLAFDGSGEPLDWVVVMRRFDQAALLDRLATGNALTPSLMTALADAIAAFHAAAEVTPAEGGRAGIEQVLAINEAGLAAIPPDIADGAAIARLCAATRDELPRLAPLLERRRREGHVRHCHGDLHLGNICLVDGKPTLFDCIEFSRELACIDVLYDLAFLLMDLEHRGQRRLASLVFNRYLDRSAEADGIAALPFFAALRAAVRAHVGSAAVVAQHDDAQRRAGSEAVRSYIDLAGRLLRPTPPRLIAIGGLSGTGKSTLAAALAPEIGGFPGALVLRSDVIRKRLLGIALEARCPPAGYSVEVTARVYAALRQQAEAALAAGFGVILDAVAARPAERAAFAAIAVRARVPFAGLWLAAEPAILEQRIDQRRGDVSDATVDVLHQQLGRNLGRIDWPVLAAGASADAVLAAARRVLGIAG